VSILLARDIRKRYGTVTALEDAGLEIEPGRSTG
jgi:ABC-type sugar transport system ATPase subunit